MKRTLPTALFLLSLLAACVAAAQPLRVLCIGDSITQGGKQDRAEYTYRLALQRLLLAEGIDFNFLGSRQQGLQPEATWPDVAPGVPFDPDHEGYYGAKTARVAQLFLPALNDYPEAPDVVLIHLGTNDQSTEDPEHDVAMPLEQMVAALRYRNPQVAILLGHLNFNDSEGANAIRPVVEELAERLDSPTSPVRTVHHYRGWHERPRQPASDTFDWAHPNPKGQAKMAVRWLEALRPLLASD